MKKAKIINSIKWTFTIVLIFFVLVYFLNQGFKSKYCGFSKLYNDSIDNIVIYKFESDSINSCHCSDSLILTNDQKASFPRKWNNSYSIGPCKFIPQYKMTVKMKNGHRRNFNVNGNTVNELKTFGFNLLCGDDYFTSIWNK
jgi:hypothetical protein